MTESDLYHPIKLFLEQQGYEVKSEIKDCDVVARRDDEPPVIVELKLGFSLPLLIQAVDRQAISDHVYIAIPKPTKSNGGALWKRNRRGLLKLCRRLGIGLLTVDMAQDPERPTHRAVQAHVDPSPYTPRQNKRRAGQLLKEFSERVGDPNQGGTSKTSIITAYRQDALRCLAYIRQNDAAALKDIRAGTNVTRAATIMQKNYYGWFERVGRGTYAITAQGEQALENFSSAIAALNDADGDNGTKGGR